MVVMVVLLITVHTPLVIVIVMISVEQSMPVIIMTAPIMPVFFFMIAVSASAAVMVTI
jgi:hypothetical protein